MQVLLDLAAAVLPVHAPIRGNVQVAMLVAHPEKPFFAQVARAASTGEVSAAQAETL